MKLDSDPPNPPLPFLDSAPARRLPLMKNFEDAASLSEKESDPFYLAAFMIQCWLGGLTLQYATSVQSIGDQNLMTRWLLRTNFICPDPHFYVK